MAGFLNDNIAVIVRVLVGGVMAAALVAVVYVAAKRTAISFDDDYAFAGAMFEPTSFDKLDGWRRDDAAAALSAFLLSCAALDGRGNDEPFNRYETSGAFVAAGSRPLAGRVGEWRPVCHDAQRLLDRAYADRSVLSSVARQFFEAQFVPVKIKSVHKPVDGGRAAGRKPVLETEGKATGYFEPVYDASVARTKEFSVPILSRPADLVSVDLGLFNKDLVGRTIAGRLSDGRLSPYPTRSDINRGVLSGKATPIAFLRPNDLFFLQIQGSGRLVFNGGGEIRVGYAGKNGRPYYAIGRSLIKREILSREEVSMQAIRLWLEEATPEEAQALREENQSYVFFRVLNDLPNPSLGPLGAQGVQLTSGRSVAVDRTYHPLGAPIWIEYEAADAHNGALYVAQDVGGAIKGPVRADIFVGSGVAAGFEAGRMNQAAELTALWPKAVAARLKRAAPAS